MHAQADTHPMKVPQQRLQLQMQQQAQPHASHSEHTSSQDQTAQQHAHRYSSRYLQSLTDEVVGHLLQLDAARLLRLADALAAERAVARPLDHTLSLPGACRSDE